MDFGGFVVTLGLSSAATSVEFTHGGFALVIMKQVCVQCSLT